MNESTLVPREEMSDLDWLARNVHVWPAGEHQHWCYVGTGYHDKTIIASGTSIGMSPVGRVAITKDQWLARRAELQNKPSFADHPDAKCFVQHSSGQWWKNIETCDVEPGFEGFWRANNVGNGLWCYVCQGDVLGDWRDTLEKRPVDLSEQAVTDRLQEATANVLAAAPELMKDKFKFEPFVSVEDAATAKQPAPKGSGNPILGMVLADLTNRALEGKEKYGEPLLAHNGRNPLWDAYQEALDLAMYLRQAIEEQRK